MKKILDPRWPQHHWHAQNSGIKILLGLRPEQPLPAEGLPAREIQGVKVWIDPLGEKQKQRRMTHRIRCECPDCGQKMSVGRLHQHICKGEAK